MESVELYINKKNIQDRGYTGIHGETDKKKHFTVLYLLQLSGIT